MESVDARNIYSLAIETLGAQCRSIEFKVKLHLEVDKEEVRRALISRVALTHSNGGIG